MDTLLHGLLDELRRLKVSPGGFFQPELLLGWATREEIEPGECDEVVELAKELGFLDRAIHPVTLVSAWRLTQAGFDAVRP